MSRQYSVSVFLVFVVYTLGPACNLSVKGSASLLKKAEPHYRFLPPSPESGGILL